MIFQRLIKFKIVLTSYHQVHIYVLVRTTITKRGISLESENIWAFLDTKFLLETPLFLYPSTRDTIKYIQFSLHANMPRLHPENSKILLFKICIYYITVTANNFRVLLHYIYLFIIIICYSKESQNSPPINIKVKWSENLFICFINNKFRRDWPFSYSQFRKYPLRDH